ncbi:UNVERIFIED_CONTAM: hypothetical protein Scaly_0995300 [Sesamum calycinum]|uniref:Uncharacterized protein n=1 Tax=Sesamum calycinum TaxID=2727403 RepID=A0AAW2QZ25_9LAMI
MAERERGVSWDSVEGNEESMVHETQILDEAHIHMVPMSIEKTLINVPLLFSSRGTVRCSMSGREHRQDGTTRAAIGKRSRGLTITEPEDGLFPMDLGFQGTIFTWCNRREAPHTVRARLDRACSTAAWATLFPSTRVRHESVSSSDHTELNDQISYLQEVELTSNNKRRLEALQSKLEEQCHREEVLWGQYAKALWLKERDKNTLFFNSRATERKTRNEIRRLKNEGGREVCDPTEIRHVMQ